jgi:hypothetical protein
MGAECAANFAGFAQQDINDHTINFVVKPVVADGHHFGRDLTIAINAAFALFETIRIPGQIIVNGGIVAFVKVDPLGDAIGGNQDALLIVRHIGNHSPTLLFTHPPSHQRYMHSGELGAQRLSHILCGRHIATPDNRRIAIVEQTTGKCDHAGQFGILPLACDLLGACGKPSQTALFRLSKVRFRLFDHRSGWLIIGLGLVGFKHQPLPEGIVNCGIIIIIVQAN